MSKFISSPLKMAAEPTREWSDEQLKSDDLPKKDIIKFIQDNAAHSVRLSLECLGHCSLCSCRLNCQCSLSCCRLHCIAGLAKWSCCALACSEAEITAKHRNTYFVKKCCTVHIYVYIFKPLLTIWDSYSYSLTLWKIMRHLFETRTLKKKKKVIIH